MPGVGRLLNEPGYVELQRRFPRPLIADAIRDVLAEERERGVESAPQARLAAVEARLEAMVAPRLVRVINGSGVVLHTNLGRAPLSAAALDAVTAAGRAYTNLELDLDHGERGDRHSLVEPLLQRLTGAEAAVVFNNNAAAVLVMLAALAGGRQVIVSRGQQVEIGGSFRMPDVMRLSGAEMVEVGTTNRTSAADYEDAIGERCAALLQVHTSNYRIVGFTEQAPAAELRAIADRHGLLLLEDLGSGALEPIGDEPTVQGALATADVVTFSGDKLLGGPQAGIALGAREPIRRMARHPLARAVRVDKLTLAALEATLRERLLDHPTPVSRMLSVPASQLHRRAAMLVVRLRELGIGCDLVEGASAVGAGSMPGHELTTWLVALEGPASRLQAALRKGEPPVLARIERDRCCIDVRTLLPGDDGPLQDAIEAALFAAGGDPG